MDLADARTAEPLNLLHHVESALGRVTHVVVGEDGGGLGPIHDPYVVPRRDRVLKAEDDAGFLGGGGDLLEDVANLVHL